MSMFFFEPCLSWARIVPESVEVVEVKVGDYVRTKDGELYVKTADNGVPFVLAAGNVPAKATVYDIEFVNPAG